MNTDTVRFMNALKVKNPNEPEFHQAVWEVVESIGTFVGENPEYHRNKILERMTEPERVVMFRVPWTDDNGDVQINRGYRVQMNSAIGPYKGGLRFHPSVSLSVLKFLAFEQVFKNSLTGLPLGGGKGGSDFNPKGKSDAEIMRFCQNFMTELTRHAGPDTDVPAGDIGVGAREIGYMFGQYKRLQNAFNGTFTGKGPQWGGSLIRPEATGYGVVYFTEAVLERNNDTIKGKIFAISGSGNVAQFAAEKAVRLGAKVVTLSDSSGYVYDKDGFDTDKLAFVTDLKNNRRGRIKEYVEAYPSAKYFESEKPWNVVCDIALPCATQNEINAEDAETLLSNGCKLVAEGANMPSVPEAVNLFQEANIFYLPSKAANAGGVAVSGLEMSQNSLRLSWLREEVDARLRNIMKNIHAVCVKYGTLPDGRIDYLKGANIGGFIKVADAMSAQGLV